MKYETTQQLKFFLGVDNITHMMKKSVIFPGCENAQELHEYFVIKKDGNKMRTSYHFYTEDFLINELPDLVEAKLLERDK